MPQPLSADDQARILALFDAGEQCNAIARQLRIAGSTVSKVCRQNGRVFDRSTQLLANRAANADLKELRERVATKMLIVAEDTLDDLDAPHLVYNFGGKDNTYEERLLDEAPIETKLNAMRAASLAVDKAARIIERDSTHGVERAEGVLDTLANGFRLMAAMDRGELLEYLDAEDELGASDALND